MSKLQRFAKDESGATAIEYGLIAAGISVAIIASCIPGVHGSGIHRDGEQQCGTAGDTGTGYLSNHRSSKRQPL